MTQMKLQHMHAQLIERLNEKIPNQAVINHLVDLYTVEYLERRVYIETVADLKIGSWEGYLPCSCMILL